MLGRLKAWVWENQQGIFLTIVVVCWLVMAVCAWIAVKEGM